MARNGLAGVPGRPRSIFSIYINTYHGMCSVDPGVIEIGRVYGLGPAALFWQILLPGALPSILIGVRFALGVMWLTLIVAETIASDARCWAG
nr:ABC transporter permease subunit [Gloeobacter morelensis]